jgi:hypothetical protein
MIWTLHQMLSGSWNERELIGLIILPACEVWEMHSEISSQPLKEGDYLETLP